MLDPHADFILALMEADKDITLVESADRLATERGLRVVPATVLYWLNRRAITFKNRTRQRATASRRAA